MKSTDVMNTHVWMPKECNLWKRSRLVVCLFVVKVVGGEFSNCKVHELSAARFVAFVYLQGCM